MVHAPRRKPRPPSRKANEPSSRFGPRVDRRKIQQAQIFILGIRLGGARSRGCSYDFPMTRSSLGEIHLAIYHSAIGTSAVTRYFFPSLRLNRFFDISNSKEKCSFTGLSHKPTFTYSQVIFKHRVPFIYPPSALEFSVVPEIPLPAEVPINRNTFEI